MDIPAITREYTPASWRNSRKPKRLFTRREMRPDSPAFCPEQLHFPNQKRKEPRFAWINSRESPTTLSQDEKKTHVTPGMQNCSVYPKSNWYEANFPCIGSITTPRSTSYRTSGLTTFRKWEIPWQNRLKYRVSSISVEQLENCSMHPISSRDKNDSLSSTEEVSQLSTSNSRGAFPQT